MESMVMFVTAVHVLASVLAICATLSEARSPELLLANRKDIKILDVENGTERSLVGGLEDAANVDFDWESQCIFYSEVNAKKIKKIAFNGTLEGDVITTGVGSLDGLAIDWLTKKVYWIDSDTNRIEVVGFDGSYRKVLVWKNLDQPRAVALVPQAGIMFWSDWGEQPKIERCDMDGSNRAVITLNNIKWPNGLTIDFEAQKLYWADARLQTIDFVDFDGKNRKTLAKHRLLAHPFSLTLYGNRLYWTDWRTRSISACNKANASFAYTVKSNIHSPMGIVALMKDRQKKSKTPCDNNNGGCSALCLLKPNSYSCACPTGIRLLDKKRCAPGLEKFLLVARRPDLRIISFDMPDYSDVVLPIGGIESGHSVDYDKVDDYIYWSDSDQVVIKRAHPNGTGVEVIVDYDIKGPEGLAVDWVARNLYWTDPDLNRIEVARLNGSSRKIIISSGLDSPRGIVVDPADGYIYWTDWGKEPKIERAELDGANRVTIVNTSIEWPNGLAIDYQERKLYWGEAKRDTIESCNLDGSNRRVILDKEVPHIFGITVLGDDIYWSDWQLRTLTKVNKHTKVVTKILEGRADLMGIKAVDTKLDYGNNACELNNFGCSHLCFYKPSGALCSCPLGMELGLDDKTCSVPVGYLVVAHRVDIRRITLDTYKRDSVIPLSNVGEASFLDFDVENNRIFWVDADYRTINSAFMNGSDVENIVMHGLELPGGVAVDWVAKNIYWTDEKANRIEVSRLNGYHRSVLIWEDLEAPNIIAVNPRNGLIYWCSWNSKPKLEQADMNGKSRKVLVDKIGKPSGLAIDYQMEYIYWTDLISHNIERVDFNGRNRKVLMKDLPHPYGLTLYSDFMYYGEWQSRTVERADKNNGTNRTRIRKMEFVMDVSAFHSSRQTGTNDCGKKNGMCAHFCFSASDGGTRCGCETHYTLAADGRSCIAPDTFLLIAHKADIRRISFESQNNPDLALPIPIKDKVKSIDFDFMGGFIYWIDSNSLEVKRIFENGTGYRQIYDGTRLGGNPFDIALEPYGGSIYWTDQLDNTIKVIRLQGDFSPSVLLSQDAGYWPRFIAVSSEHGRLFWTNHADESSIETCSLDGTGVVSLVKVSKGTLGDLTIDHVEKRIYWIDLSRKTIESADFQGQHLSTVVAINLLFPVGLAVHGDYLFWSDKKTLLTERVLKSSGNERRIVSGKFTDLADVVAVNRSRRSVYHPCGINNGNCSHICLIDEKESASTEVRIVGRRCACPVGLVLDKSHKQCYAPKKCPAGTFQCAIDGSCIDIKKKCNRQTDCLDQSDEKNCPGISKYCDLSKEFDCGDECIALSKECNGARDCRDGRDEMDCPGTDCGKSSFSCPTTKECIPRALHCNGFDNCGDNSDEDGCPSHVNGTLVGSGSSDTYKHVIAGVSTGIGLVFILGIAIFVIARCKMQRDVARCTVQTDIGLIATGRKGSSTASLKPSETSMSYVSVTESQQSPPSTMYNRHRLTGASSAVSSTSGYSHIPEDPPPSPATMRTMSLLSGFTNDYSSVVSAVPCYTCHGCRQTFCAAPSSVTSYRYSDCVPPPTPAASSIADTELVDYYAYEQAAASRHAYCANCQVHRRTNRGHVPRRSRSHRHMFAPLHGHIAEEERSPLHGDNISMVSSVQSRGYLDPYLVAPPPTPYQSEMQDYGSDEESQSAMSMSTIRQHPYPPPPSPTSQLL